MSNSWQQPDNNSPSVGTLHRIAYTSFNLINGGTATSFTDISLTALVPVGTKAVLLGAAGIATSNTTGQFYCGCSVRPNGGTINPGVSVIFGLSPAINGTTYEIHGTLIVDVPTDRIIEYLNFTTGNSSRSAYITLLGYYL
jgi:hypothetical protein